MFLSISLQNFNCKDNIRHAQKSSTPILFNLIKAKFCCAIGIDAVWRSPRLRLRKPGGAALMEIFGYIVSGLAFLIVKNNLAIFLFDAYFFTTVGKRTHIKKIPVVLDYL